LKLARPASMQLLRRRSPGRNSIPDQQAKSL
jgi:hypothetical protein